MSALLQAVEIARERRDVAQADYAQADAGLRAAIVRAREEHSLRQIARAAGVTYNGVRHLAGEDVRKGKEK